MLKQLAETVQ